MGAGTAGLAAAALLARAGHEVEVLERAPNPGPVGAGLLLQPTGMAVLERLGVLDEVRAGAARIERVVGTTVEGQRFMDLAYAGGEDVHGLGVHRGALFTRAARGGGAGRGGAAAGRRGRPAPGPRRCSTPAARATARTTGSSAPTARARRCAASSASARASTSTAGARCGASSPTRRTRSTATLDQYFDGARRMAGFLPTGSGAVSLFWSVRLDRIEAVRAAGIDAFRADLLSLAPVGEPLLGGLTSMDQLLPASYRQVSLPRWHDGTLVLLGDAAHALSPQLGQGANLALMDAAALADARVAGRRSRRARRAAGALLRLRRAGAERRLPERSRRVRVAARPSDGAGFAAAVGARPRARRALRTRDRRVRADPYVKRCLLDAAVQATGWTARPRTACQVSASVVPVTGRPREVWKLRSAVSVAASNVLVDRHRRVEGREVLLQPDDLVALVALGQRRPARVRRRQRRRRERRGERAPSSASVGGLPRPPATARRCRRRPTASGSARCPPAAGCRRSGRAGRSRRRRCGCARACGRRRRRPSRRCPSSRPAAGSPARRPGRGRPSTAAAGGSRRTGTRSARSGRSGRRVARSAAMYCCAAAYLPSYCDSASITRQSAPSATRRRRGWPRPAGRCRRRTATRRRAGRWRAAPATSSGLNCAQRFGGAVGALDEHGRHPGGVRAGGDRGDVAALGASAAPRSTCRCPGRPSGSVPGAGAGPPTCGGAADGDRA